MFRVVFLFLQNNLTTAVTFLCNLMIGLTYLITFTMSKVANFGQFGQNNNNLNCAHTSYM